MSLILLSSPLSVSNRKPGARSLLIKPTQVSLPVYGAEGRERKVGWGEGTKGTG